ncbi:unnamed protein product [Rhizophagus irregularis]|nr:unnamed protein product [Rhizophagus irregularis]
MNKRIKEQTGLKAYIYIDGSVINNGTENIAGLAGINIYDENYNFIDKTYVSLDNWITAANLLALLVIHDCFNVETLTDNENICDRYVVPQVAICPDLKLGHNRYKALCTSKPSSGLHKKKSGLEFFFNCELQRRTIAH